MKTSRQGKAFIMVLKEIAAIAAGMVFKDE